MSTMTPREIVHELDHHIIGQNNAKRAVAIALRNRWRRMQVSDELRNEITPKNIKEKDDFLDVYRKLLDIVPKIPDEEHDDILICENEDYRIYAKFGECETRDNMVIYFGTSKKRMYIYKEKLN